MNQELEDVKKEIYQFMEDHPRIRELYEKKDKFILDENNNAISANLYEWSDFLENEEEKRIVKQEEVNGYMVSTIFIGVIHSWDETKLDIFETMIFKGESGIDIYCDRYDTWKQAEEGHKKAVQWVLDGCKEKEEENETK